MGLFSFIIISVFYNLQKPRILIHPKTARISLTTRNPGSSIRAIAVSI
ncbi:hypothetical protein CLOSTASPAR_03767 [[Clostridium] asparagiforme DSM 15981]|uniref:Uncharacterized protein n=1 Tax=[Clostridium] asparagiforme DSM 15981 TaxID=518636 RepID=C0D3C6_9FIRM|nr:hypothetical protein CLOSTASPAR_03767 [[Clostridium] asparagiforme DSM 15981]